MTHISDMEFGVQGAVDAERVQEVQSESVGLADGTTAPGCAAT